MSEHRGELTREGERFPTPGHGLDYLAIEPPEVGALAQIAEGLHWARIPLPMELTHINVWLLEDGDGWMLVDTGMAHDTCRAAWESLKQQALGRRLRRIFVTHDHPDHMGLAPWLAERHGAEVWMSQAAHASTEAFLATSPDDLGARIRGFLHSHGVPGVEAPASSKADHRAWFGGLPRLAASPQDGDAIDVGGGTWRVMATDGHCRGHLCLHDEGRGLLVSGDQVLPSISPNVSVLSSAPLANPLGEFLESLERLARCSPTTLVLPSHGRPFRGLQRRIRVLADHHAQQLRGLEAYCREPRTAFETLPTLFRRVPSGFHRLLAVGEAVAHLNYLVSCGKLARQQDPDGVIRHVAA